MYYTVLVAEICTENLEKKEKELKAFVNAVANYLNKVFAKSLKAKTEYKSGKFQAVYTSPVAAFLYNRLLRMFLYPLQIRSGFGEGKLYLEVGLDGPAYFNALEALKHADGIALNTCFVAYGKTDKYINLLLKTSDYLSRKESISINLVKLMAELYIPLFKKEYMNYFEYQEDQYFLKALYYKEEFYNYISLFDPSIRGLYPNAKNFQIPKIEDCKIYNLDDLYNKEHPELINGFWRKGFSSKIAYSLNNTSRQNVDKHLDGRIIFQRNIDGGIALFLGEKKI